MGSVISYETCPRCSSEESLVNDFYYKSGEESNFCHECGYYDNFFYKRDEQGNVILKDPEAGFVPDNMVELAEKCENPFGVVRCQYDKGASISVLETQDAYDQMKASVDEFVKEHPQLNQIEFSQFIDGEIRKEILYKKAE